METDDAFLCHKCGKIFYKLSTLESHSRWKHAEKTNEFMCDQCGRTFQKKYNLIKHLESAVHDISESVNCALCVFKALNRKLMCEHYQSWHGIHLKETNVYFKTPEEFFVWKSEYENKTKSRFVKMSSSRMRKNGFIRSTYFCHRDGNFIPKGRNLRHMKVKGSNKINAHCPAKIEVEMGEKITIVSYIDTHLGHNQDISRMSIDPDDKLLIAKKLALKVPFDQILDDINSFRRDGIDTKRVHLLTRKDLWNIVDSFKINPKNVVFSKNNIRRKKKMQDLENGQRMSSDTLNMYSQENNSVDDEKVIYEHTEEEEYTDTQVVSVKQENIVYYPVDEDHQYVEGYSLMADESDEEGGTCLIINANGELESITGHKIIYTEEGNIEICKALNMDESKIIYDDGTTVSQQTQTLSKSETRKNEETEDYFSEGVSTNKSTLLKSKMTSSQNETGYNEKLDECVTENVNYTEVAEDQYIQLMEVEEVVEDPETVIIKTENNEGGLDQSMMSVKDDSSQYEVTISNYQGGDDDYVIISTENEDMVECGSSIDSSETYTTTEDLDASISLETVVLDTSENGHEYNIESTDVIATSGGPAKWKNTSRVLQKTFNIEDLSKLNSEQELHVYSSNISSLENVIEVFSENISKD
ncbi:uncharacterized protein LOC129005285 [Macrosteles quadrilineatus]|uniref:uncharacterized protein LOC129005285 n=1 Tax=Macrosteles quadrilineatus TaxID=74068 RepID=UPI0023E1BD8D|nr:uncharacterized protein LOC129005285 [Macrosteles quadrilineatus]